MFQHICNIPASVAVASQEEKCGCRTTSLILLWTTFYMISFFKWKRKPLQYSRKHTLFSSPRSMTFSTYQCTCACLPSLARKYACSQTPELQMAHRDSTTNFFYESCIKHFIFKVLLLSVVWYGFLLVNFFKNINKLVCVC